HRHPSRIMRPPGHGRQGRRLTRVGARAAGPCPGPSRPCLLRAVTSSLPAPPPLPTLGAGVSAEVAMAHSVLARKPLDMLLAEVAGDNRLRRVLGPVQLTSLGIGAVIGA